MAVAVEGSGRESLAERDDGSRDAADAGGDLEIGGEAFAEEMALATAEVEERAKAG